MVVVKKQKGESDDHLINRFRKKVIDENIIIDFRDRARHKKKAELRKEKSYRIAHLIELEKKRNLL